MKCTLPTQSLIITILALTLTYSFGQNLYPEDAGVVNVTQAPYFATGDGVADDTEAIQQAMNDHPDGNFIIYLPEGVYRITDRIDWPRVDENDTNCGTEQSCRYTILQGDGPDRTLIQLADNNEGYQDAKNPRALLWCGQGVAQRFRDGLRGMTVNTGQGNPGAIGVQFNANNRGGIENVVLVDGDNSGQIGIDLSYTDEIGPLLVKDVEIEGFNRGVQTFFNVNSMTFEDITLRNQRQYGFRILQQVVTIRRLTSFNSVPAVYAFNQGSYVTLLDSELNGLNGTGTAILYGTEIFIRNVATTNYGAPLKFILNGTTPINVGSGDDFIAEYTSAEPLSLCVNEKTSLSLPVEETPDIAREPISAWVSVEDFGATRGDDTDDTQAFQEALNSGAKTIYVPVTSFRRQNGFITQGTITVPATVERIIGTQGNLGGATYQLTGSSSDPIVLEDLQIESISHTADRTVVLKHVNLDEYTTDGGGDLFLEDVQLKTTTFRDQRVWARQLNYELAGQAIVNDNAQLWILGFKTERRGTRIATLNGGFTEVLGGHVYSTQSATEDPMFSVEDASVSLAGIRETNFSGDPYPNLVEETRGEVTRTYTAADGTPGGINASGWPLYVGYVASGENQAPTVEAGANNSIFLEDETYALQGQANDDGLPGNQCFVATEWSQVAGPDGATIVVPDALGTTVTFTQSGQYRFELLADDGERTARDTVAVYVYDETITTADGRGADATVYSANASFNYGGASTVDVRRNNAFTYKGYFRLDLTSLSSSDSLVLAELYLENANSNGGVVKDWTFNVFGLRELDTYGEGSLGEDWTEGELDGAEATADEITYANAPANVGDTGGAYDPVANEGGGVNNDQTVFLGTFRSRDGRSEPLTFRSDLLSDFLNNDSNGLITLIVTRVETNANVLNFASKELESLPAPTLRVAYRGSSNLMATVGEAGVSRERQANAQAWTTINLNNGYERPVVVMGPPSFNGGQPTTVRVRQAESNQFQYQLDEWDYLDGSHVSEDLGYLVVDEGTYRTEDNRTVIAARQEGITHNWTTVTFPQPFAAPPVILAQCATYNDPSAVVVRIRNRTATGFELRLQESRGQDGTHAAEQVHWVAMDSGTSETSVANVTPPVIKSDFQSVDWEKSVTSPPVLLANIQTFSGSHPVSLRYRNFAESGAEFRAEEEDATGDGTDHPNGEAVGYWVFAQPQNLYATKVSGNARIASQKTKVAPAVFESSKLSIYPNPTYNGELNLRFASEAANPSGIVRFINLSGATQWEVPVQGGSSTLNVDQLARGTYVVQVILEDQLYYQRVIIE